MKKSDGRRGWEEIGWMLVCDGCSIYCKQLFNFRSALLTRCRLIEEGRGVNGSTTLNIGLYNV